jgi:hypothetical protein
MPEQTPFVNSIDAASVPSDELKRLRDAHAAALDLADAVEAILAIENSEPSAVRSARGGEHLSASEIRNRFRRRIEESTLRLKTTLAKFRAVAGDPT